jgi:hypothetical protein
MRALFRETLLWTAHYGKVGGINQLILPSGEKSMMRTAPMFMFVALLFAMALFSGCANLPHYVRLQQDSRVEPVFTNGLILPQYRYFYNGPDTEPTALLALDRDWTLDGLYWTEIALTETQLKKWLRQFSFEFGNYDMSTHVMINYSGMTVPDPNGQMIGAIYARYGRYGRVYVRYGADKHLTIVGPELPATSVLSDD